MPVDGDIKMSFVELATHWSGLTNKPTNLFYEQDDPYIGYTDEMFFEDLKAYNFTAEELHIDSQYFYSNYAYGLLGYILSNEIYESNFKNLMETIILQPLFMNNSALTIDDKPKTFANGHEETGQQVPWGQSCETVLGKNSGIYCDYLKVLLNRLYIEIKVLTTAYFPFQKDLGRFDPQREI